MRNGDPSSCYGKAGDRVINKIAKPFLLGWARGTGGRDWAQCGWVFSMVSVWKHTFLKTATVTLFSTFNHLSHTSLLSYFCWSFRKRNPCNLLDLCTRLRWFCSLKTYTIICQLVSSLGLWIRIHVGRGRESWGAHMFVTNLNTQGSL